MQTQNKKRKFYNFRKLPQDMARLLCAILLLVYRVKRITPEGTPYREKLHGGAILAANHTSFSDPFVVGVTFWYRRVNFLVAEVVMSKKLRAMLLRGVGAIEIDRNIADIEAIRKATTVLKEGNTLCVFPQGAITKEDSFEAVKSGAVLIALQAGVPIVPIHIEPQPHWYNRQVVTIGKTIDPKDYIKKKFPSTADINRVTEVLMNEMSRCKNHEIPKTEETI